MEHKEQNIHAEQQFNANVQDLYDAWVNLDKLKEWWHPANNKLVNVENNVSEGGNIKYEFETGEGKKAIIITGAYKEVKPAEKLVYTWNWQVPEIDNVKDNEFELTVTFNGDETSSTINIEQANKEALESIQPHIKGWQEELESLQKFLS